MAAGPRFPSLGSFSESPAQKGRGLSSECPLHLADGGPLWPGTGGQQGGGGRADPAHESGWRGRAGEALAASLSLCRMGHCTLVAWAPSLEEPT